jgi:GTP-binding protein
MPLPIVAIIGRPNVGKSSLFNRIIRQKLAVVDEQSGVTRDRNFALCSWRDRTFYAVDTGGMVPGTDDQMERLILEQAEIAVGEADTILFVVDCQTGVTDIDARIARLLLRADKPVLLCANKADNELLELEANRFFTLGFDTIAAASAASGRGVGDLLDEVLQRLPAVTEEPADTGAIRVAVVGRPNVGKSSLVNYLLGEQRNIVSDVPGTTRDAIDSPVTIDDRRYVLVDTAGLRKRSRITDGIEYYTTLRTIRAIERCDVAMILVDADQGLNLQELKIIEEVGEAGKGMVLVVNKWDIFEKDEHSAEIYTRQIQQTVPTYSYVPAVFISALTGKRVMKALSVVNDVYDQFTRRIATPELNDFLEEAVSRQTPPATQGKWIRLFYMTQPETAPPAFVIFTNHPRLIQEPYKRFLTNQLRERFGFAGVPLQLKFKARQKKSN